MKNYRIKSILLNTESVPFTIKLISAMNSDEEVAIHIITLKAKLKNYLANINVSTPKIIIIQNIFEKFLQPLLDRNILIAAAVNGGGDMQVGVAKRQEFIWNIAIEDPQNRTSNIYTYHLQNGAIATENLLNKKKSDTNIPLLQQATIVATNLIQADTLATTAITMGEQKFAELSQEQKIYGVLINQKHTMTVLE